MAGQSGAVPCHTGSFPFPVTNSFLQSSFPSSVCKAVPSPACCSAAYHCLVPRDHTGLMLCWRWAGNTRLCQWGLCCKLQGGCGNRAGKNHCSIQFCISVVRKSDGKVIYYCACGCEPGWTGWWWGPATPVVQGRVVVCEVQGTVCVPVGSILGWQSEASCGIPKQQCCAVPWYAAAEDAH